MKHRTVPRVAIAPYCYYFARAFFKMGVLTSLRVGLLRMPGSEPSGGYVLACTHLSHLEPLCASVFTRRRIHWMARVEFFRSRIGAMFMRSVDTFSVNRQGVPVRAIRTAIERTRQGNIVGVFPEGGVVIGRDAVFRGGVIKRGAAMIACAAGVPIVPCVVLGTHKLNRVMPWLPFKRGRLWIAFGHPVSPRPYPAGRLAVNERRRQRAGMTEELQAEFIRLYDELRQRYGIAETDVP